jgi:hypothetical protein
MTKTVRVRLHWLVKPNHGQRIVRPVRFDHQGDEWTKDAWSLVIDADNPADADGYQLGSAQFLSPDGPHQWLCEGRHFTLFEGSPVAEGEILPP